MNGLLRETNALIQAAQDGKLQTTRPTPANLPAAWKIVHGVNKLRSTPCRTPSTSTAEYVDRISKGDIPPKITDNYNGDFNPSRITSTSASMPSTA